MQFHRWVSSLCFVCFKIASSALHVVMAGSAEKVQLFSQLKPNIDELRVRVKVKYMWKEIDWSDAENPKYLGFVLMDEQVIPYFCYKKI